MCNTVPKENPVTNTPPREAKECCEKISTVVDSTLAPSKVFVLRNPVASVLGALSFGIALGYMIAMAATAAGMLVVTLQA